MLLVTCAIIIHNDHVLICQRSAQKKLPLKWEFPGGKIERKETKEECLKRELREELEIDIKIIKPLTAVRHEYYEESIVLYPFICNWIGGEIKVIEHEQVLWVSKNELKNYDLATADLMIVEELLKL